MSSNDPLPTPRAGFNPLIRPYLLCSAVDQLAVLRSILARLDDIALQLRRPQ